MNRRDALKNTAVAAAIGLVAGSCKDNGKPIQKSSAGFKYCLNTSTIREQVNSVDEYIRIAGEAGYDGVELWVRDVKKYQEEGKDMDQLRQLIENSGLTVENAIGFATWLANDDEVRAEGMMLMEEEMFLMKQIGCKRIAAAPAGFQSGDSLDLSEAGKRYAEVLKLGRKTGVQPILEFWGASPVLYQLGQVLMIAAGANDPDAKILADVYHLFRGGSGFEGLKLVNGQAMNVFHINDYPGDIPREEQKDADRVFPGDGVAPLKQILTDLKNMGGEKILSLELFNPQYYQMDPLEVAKTGLKKMKLMVETIG